MSKYAVCRRPERLVGCYTGSDENAWDSFEGTYEPRDITRLLRLRAACEFGASEMPLVCRRKARSETKSALDGSQINASCTIGGVNFGSRAIL